MTAQFWSAERSRKIIKRIVVEGTLVLETPAHFGSGDGDDLTDMPLLVDSYDGKTPLLTGASIAGALRSYLREREYGFGEKEEKGFASATLFGGIKGDKGDDEGVQSPLIVDDAFGSKAETVLRDGVRLKPETRTAADKALFNVELWQAGTSFALRFELLVYEPDKDNPTEGDLQHALATALTGLDDGDITLGMRKRRGYGRVSMSEWRLKTYDLTTVAGLLDWLENGNAVLDEGYKVESIASALKVDPENLIEDQREIFIIEAEFSLDGSLLIRSGTGKDDLGPDSVHLHAVQADSSKSESRDPAPQPVLSGTSLAGALRARALKIASTVENSEQKKAKAFIDEMFGLLDTEIGKGEKAQASRLRVRESVIREAETDLVQNRVSLDRFTGGARDGALFNQSPIFGGEDSRLTLHLQLDNPTSAQVGLLLLLLKDLWTGDLSLGGEASVGRGRLKGRQAKLRWQKPSNSDKKEKKWQICTNGDANELKITGDDRLNLEECVTVLNTHLQGGTA